MKFLFNITASVTMFTLLSCSNTRTVFVQNMLDKERSFETVTLTKEFLELQSLEGLGIKNTETNEYEITQLIDVDGDGIMDEIIFQPTIAPYAKSIYKIANISKSKVPKGENLCYSRFVPERTDDYTWENDKVAFRVYGPTAQRLNEENDPTGTLSSGIDAWLKRVSYPIINKWYQKTVVDKTGSYHVDTGEGLDNFHVGSSRGVGGSSVKVNGEYYISKNYTEWRTITTGPLRTSFYLKYADWKADDKNISEYKVITLDRGSNLSKIEDYITGTDVVSVGLTLHKQEGVVYGDKAKGWISYWEPLDDSEIGTAVVATGDSFINNNTYIVDNKDLCNAFVDLKVTNNQAVYYSGFGWKKAGEFKTKEDWYHYLSDFKTKIDNPLIVKRVK
ncbi:DUF4861 family protein [Wenyingzhuangia sp. chi5]|uniref:DUF4861 family protein n=1 Tax=Wenyingzhuangia gilva TaxID=3057677 RepID=A0ABT8VQZ4_9FLAO|nr:DUF4861 family protein [Wenyingzhuangia sp. chi5]MDO3694367.1 DUF4861 family protein [Wenyingzhuangia sp. chi5]